MTHEEVVQRVRGLNPEFFDVLPNSRDRLPLLLESAAVSAFLGELELSTEDTEFLRHQLSHLRHVGWIDFEKE